MPYRDAGAAGRSTLRRANGLRLSVLDRRVLGAVLSETAFYSRLETRLYLAQLAAFTFGVDEAKPWMKKRTREALRRLTSAGLVYAIAPKGRPGVASGQPAYRIGIFPATETDPRPRVDDQSNPRPETDPHPKVSGAVNGPRASRVIDPDPQRNGPRLGIETDPRSRGPHEKDYEKTYEERARTLVEVPHNQDGTDALAPLLARLITDHGQQPVADAIASLPDTPYRYARHLRHAIEANLAIAPERLRAEPFRADPNAATISTDQLMNLRAVREACFRPREPQ